MKLILFLLVAILSLSPTISFASEALVTLKKPGKAERKFLVKNLNFICNTDKTESFVVEMDGAITEIPFTSIAFIIYHEKLNNYQAGIKNRKENKSIFALKPVCEEFKFEGENEFGGNVSFASQYLERIEFK